MAFSVKFLTIPIWVQVWGLPFDLINEEAMRDIGQGIGRVVEVDCKAIALDQARFLRVRVDMLDKPIRRGPPILSPEGDKVWVAFQYKRLLGLCFHCGRLGHDTKKLQKHNTKGGGGKSIRRMVASWFSKTKSNARQRYTMSTMAAGDRGSSATIQ